VEHELAARSAGIGGGDRGLDAELVGRAGFAFADGFDLGGGIELPPALALLLGTDLLGARERLFQYGLEIGLAGDLAADIADMTAGPRAQAQLAMMTLELLGVGIAPAIIAARLAMRRYDWRSCSLHFSGNRLVP
jgi:hypothetical protein